MAVEFKEVAARALTMAEILLPQWIGGHLVGREWKGGKKASGGPGDSWSVNIDTGKWIHGATGTSGGDLISLWAALQHIEQQAALFQVNDMLGGTDENVKRLPMKAAPAKLE